MSDVRAAAPAERDAVLAILVAAFQDDPVSRWVFPDAERRRAISHPAFFGALLDAGFAAGHVDLTEDHTAAVIWLPPSGDDDGPIDGLLETELARLGELLELMVAREPAGPLWHAQFIGVLPEHQGGGIGERLMRHGLDRADAEGVPAYLEASSPDSTRLYRRLGFRDHGPAFNAPGGPPMQPMWRAPS
ncbi:GNAT family N-acetyltransferase [Amycolatopsis sp. OK19-0408]|uniref:GNAT family N-acetyltransferase n=1 Tax=Amycolatopsis iheyensis TaxID=2945988 RepID=A0A9X2SQN6_9PSEU|nr:GNAT family N-acetyltransferase [Amycolatopsis iheyensis]MCR6488890.1 GNAT family N-acetyltransferase [Amycolatopsis iheyensis]